MHKNNSSEQADQFLAQCGEFRLGVLTTEQPHTVTRELSQTAEKSVTEALKLLFQVDDDVVQTYRRWAATDAPERISDIVLHAVRTGHRVFFTGCGATGRLSILLESIWREYWQRAEHTSAIPDLKNAIESVMSGGDYALIKSVEGFEDFTQFGGKQIEDMGVSEGDVVFAITEGGETSFVIGTAWKGLEKGAKVYFVYCNPDDVLRETVVRSREVIEDSRIEKINLTTGPMGIMGSTRMQATSIQLLAMVTILEKVVEKLDAKSATSKSEINLPELADLHATLMSDDLREQLAGLVELEAKTYQTGHKSTYFTDHFGIDVLTDTTERSPTFCTPAFRKWDDKQASESWSYLILPHPDAESAWSGLLKRAPYGLNWSDEEIHALVSEDKAERQIGIMRQIGPQEILRFRIGTDGLQSRPIVKGDLAVCVVAESELDALTSPDGFFRKQMEQADMLGASTAVIFLGRTESLEQARQFLQSWNVKVQAVLMPIPDTSLHLDTLSRVGVKMLLNTHSTCVMVRLGRVQGNCMVAVVPSNLKLIDRSTRYVQTLTGLSYQDACHLLFESIEHVKGRMLSGQSYPPPVELTATRSKEKCTLDEAEAILKSRA